MRLEERTYIDKQGKATTDRTKGIVLVGPKGMILDDDKAAELGIKVRAKTDDKMVTKRRAKAITIPIEKA